MVTRIKRRRSQQLALLDADGNVTQKPQKSQKPRKRRRGVRLGRPPQAKRIGFVAHGKREEHVATHPVHVSMKRVARAPSLRSQLVYRAILGQLARVKEKGVRVVHYSVQVDHMHLIVEGKNREDLAKQMQRLFSRIALAVNAVAKRRGSLWRDRHHRRELTSPTQTRRALVYVLFNDRKHDAENGGDVLRSLTALDEHSSVSRVEAWSENARPPPELLAAMRRRNVDQETGESPISAASTWLARTGWFQRGGGRLRLHELPRIF